MSGSPPPEPPKDPAQFAGRRRKRSDSPPSTTTTTSADPFPAVVEQSLPRYAEQPEVRRYREEPAMQIAPQPQPYLPPPLPYGFGQGPSVTQHYPPTLSNTQQQVSPRTTRKTKAHVASACINCKKKHLRCDSSRPCRRCVQSGKEDTCKDVEHKKRGRPPLKPEDPTSMGRHAVGATHPGAISGSTARHAGDLRGHAPSNYPPILPHAPPMFGHHRASSRSSLYTGFQSVYAAPSVAQSSLTATASFSYPTRPQSTSSSVSTQPQSPYFPQGPYTGHAMPRQTQPYSNYPFHPIDIPPTTQPYYSNPIFPREHMTQATPAERQYSHGLQLPPIRPVQQAVLDPSIVQQRPSGPPAGAPNRRRRSESGERDAKRPKMDIQGILGPKHD